MAMADSVPGVSGGTIAFILGQYENFISAISGLTSKNQRVDSIKYLLRFGLGWIIGFVFAVSIISRYMESHIYEINSMFLAFIIFAVIIIIKQEKATLNNHKNLIFSLIGFLLVVVITLFGLQIDVSQVSVEQVSLLVILYIFVSGVVAISAMLLPGISGSTVLLIFGIYYLIIDTVHEFFSFDFSNIWILFIFGFGVLFGMFFATKIISKLMKNYYQQMLYLIIGLMIGSLISIITGPSSLNDINGVAYEYLSLNNFSILFFIVGAIIMLLINRLKEV